MMRKNIFRILFLLIAVSAMVNLTSCDKEETPSKFEVAFNTDGGTMYYNIRANEGDTITLPTPEKEGYEFIGWYDNAEASGDALPTTYAITTNITLYAKWNAYKGTIKFESNGGTTYNDLEFIAQKVEIPTPKKEGFVFGGWYKSENFAGNIVSGTILPKTDMTLYAKWDAITGSVVFESNGGTKYERIDTAGQKVSLPIPVKEDYVFAGWYDNPNFTGNVYEGEILPEKTITLYARWASGFTLISFESNGGLQLQDLKLFDNDKLSLPTPSRYGYSFKGWYDNQDLTGEPVNEYFYYPTEDVTLYAKWEKCNYLYLFYGETKMDWKRFEYPVNAVVTLEELNSLFTPEDIVLKDYLGYEHNAPFKHWSHQGYDETSHVEVTSDLTLDEDFIILVAQYDDSTVPPAEHLKYDKENDIYTVTGKVAHVFIEDVKQQPYAFSVDISFRKGIGGGVGPAFRMNVSDANYHYEGGCDYLSPVISPDNGSLYVASVLGGKWSTFVSSIDLSLLPKSWQEKFINAGNDGKVNLTMTVVDYGTSFEVYIDNELALTYTNATKLASYTYDDLGVRSSTIPAELSNASVTYGHKVSFVSGVAGITAEPTTWLCGKVELPNLLREGYALEGWYYDEALTQRVDDSKFAITSDVTLYAKWSEQYHVVSFNTNGGTSCADLNWHSGKLSLPTTTKMNYIFTGWYYDEALTQLVDEYNFSTTTNITLYAGWRLPYSHLTTNADGSYTYSKKTEAVLGTLETGVPTAGTYHEFSQTIAMTKGVASVGIAFRMNMNKDYTYETAGTDYLSIQFAGGVFRVSCVENGKWRRIIPNNLDYAFEKMPQSWQDKYNNTATNGQITVKLTIKDYGSYFEAYIDDVLAYTYGQNGETTDLTKFTGNGYGIRCSAGTTVIFADITAVVKNN